MNAWVQEDWRRPASWTIDILFCNDNRGYVNTTTITKDALTADFRVLDYVTTPGSLVSTKPPSPSRTEFRGSSVVEPCRNRRPPGG
jgi:hypothetical protein